FVGGRVYGKTIESDGIKHPYDRLIPFFFGWQNFGWQNTDRSTHHRSNPTVSWVSQRAGQGITIDLLPRDQDTKLKLNLALSYESLQQFILIVRKRKRTPHLRGEWRSDVSGCTTKCHVAGCSRLDYAPEVFSVAEATVDVLAVPFFRNCTLCGAVF